MPLGHAHDPAALRQRLQQGALPDAICVTHNETSTGVIQPLRELSAVIREHAPKALILVDVVTSLAGAELRFDEWDLDYAFAGTQKCLALPPGLGVYAVSDRALAVADGIDERGFLLDLPKSVKDTNAGKTLATPCVPLVYALQRQLDRIQTEGLEQRWHRHLELQAKTLAWAETKGFTPFVGDSAARSPAPGTFTPRAPGRAAGLEKNGEVVRAALHQVAGVLHATSSAAGADGDAAPATHLHARLLIEAAEKKKRKPGSLSLPLRTTRRTKGAATAFQY